MPALFIVVLHHLSPDVKETGVQFADTELRGIPEERLRSLVAALSALTRKNHGTAVPELRITAPLGRFSVQIAEGKLRFNSWSTRVGGFDLTEDEIVSVITGSEDRLQGTLRPANAAKIVAVAPPAEESAPSSPGKIISVIAVIIAINAITVWMVIRPAPNPFLPETTLLAPEQAERLLKDVAGEYRTGSAPGDRGITIATDGRIHCVKFGKGGMVIEATDITSEAVQKAGHASLRTSSQGLVEFIDSSTVTLFGDTYRRKGP